MYTLKMFGGLLLEGPEGPLSGRAVHRRRLALLALLAVAGRPVSREELIAHLWPEHPSDASRHLLSESVYILRKALGDDVLTLVGDAFRLDSSIVRSDLEEFHEALAAGDLERAISLCRGPFLDGFYVSDAPAFERWTAAQRERLAYAYAGAVATLARRAGSVARVKAALEETAWGLEEEVLSVLVDPGTAPPEEIAEVLARLSVLYRKLGGSGITFSLREAHVLEPEPW